MTKYIKCINYLISKKTNSVTKSPSTTYNSIYTLGSENYFNHFLTVYNILRKWNCDEDTCFAGLFHFIYSNEIRRGVPFSSTAVFETDREVIKELIGPKAESYVYQFNADRYQNKICRTINFANSLSKPLILVTDEYYDAKDTDDFYFYFRDIVKWGFIGSGKKGSKNWRKFYYDVDFKNKFEKKLRKYTDHLLTNYHIKEFLKLDRCYASASPYGTVHEIHTDYVEPHQGITVMYYLNSNWDFQLGGETVFFDIFKKDIIKSIIPKPGRVIVFDGGYPHCARETVRNFNDLRMVVTFKYSIKL